MALLLLPVMMLVNLIINFVAWFLTAWITLILFNLSGVEFLAELTYMQVVWLGMAFTSAVASGAVMGMGTKEAMS